MKGSSGPVGTANVVHDAAPQGPSQLPPMETQFPEAHANGAQRTKPTTISGTRAENEVPRIARQY